MCFDSSRSGSVTADPASRASNAAADAVVARRKDAQGFAWTLGGGATPANSPPSIARSMLGIG